MATFFVVATPIGNLEDITVRALSVLKSVDFILCEDTRITKRLLTRYGVATPTMSYHVHSKLSQVRKIIGLLKEGKNLALVSDAGTPGISDPGAELVALIREEFHRDDSAERSRIPRFQSDENPATLNEVKIEAIPGPSALTAALSIAGVPCADFTFLGFLPHKKGRETLFKKIAQSERTAVFYESPHRIMKTLESLVKSFAKETGSIWEEAKSGKERVAKKKQQLPKRITVCRELTKIFEEVISGTAEEVKKYFESHPDKVRGEFVVIVSE